MASDDEHRDDGDDEEDRDPQVSRHRRSGIPPEVEKGAALLPGRLGRDVTGTIRRLRESRFVGLSAEVAFFFALGLPPLVLTFLALLGVSEPLVGDEITGFVEEEVRGILAQNLSGGLEENALGTLDHLLGGSPGLLLVPLVVAVYLSVRGFTGAMRGIAFLHGTEVERPFWQDALMTLAFTTGAALLGVLAVIATVLAALPDGPLAGPLDLLRWALLPVLVAVYLAALYRYARDGGDWASGLVGGLLGALGMLAAALAYATLLRRTPELGLGPFLGPVLAVVLGTLSFVYSLAASVLLGGAYSAHLSADADPDQLRRSAR